MVKEITAKSREASAKEYLVKNFPTLQGDTYTKALQALIDEHWNEFNELLALHDDGIPLVSISHPKPKIFSKWWWQSLRHSLFGTAPRHPLDNPDNVEVITFIDRK